MSDIVERLRSYARNCGGPPEEYLTWQAADEIERLQKEWLSLYGVERMRFAALQRVAVAPDMQAEIKRLRTALRQIELNTREGDPLIKKLNWVARAALTGGKE